jgi:hypothetical protein
MTLVSPIVAARPSAAARAAVDGDGNIRPVSYTNPREAERLKFFLQWLCGHGQGADVQTVFYACRP